MARLIAGAAAVDHHRPHADGLHEDDVQQQMDHRPIVFHDAAAELDDGDFAAELADPREGFDQDVGFLNGFFQRLAPKLGGKVGKRRLPAGTWHLENPVL